MMPLFDKYIYTHTHHITQLPTIDAASLCFQNHICISLSIIYIIQAFIYLITNGISLYRLNKTYER